MKSTLGSLVVAISITICLSQSAPTTKKPSPESKPVAPRFVCPDPEAMQGCNSYEQLLKAGDKDLPNTFDDSFVCFRKNVDEFFVFDFSKPIFEHWNDKVKNLVVDNQTVSGSGYTLTYKDGVEDSRVLPYFDFSGTWDARFGARSFSADSINSNQIDQNGDPDTGVSINDTQISVQYKYQNTMNEPMQYNLTIQRSTGRFFESFVTASKPQSFLERTGRCVYRKSNFKE